MSTTEDLHVPLADDWSDSEVEEDQLINQSINQKRYCTSCCRGLTRRQLIVLIFVVFIVLIVLIAVIFTVIIPRIIQSTINGSSIQLTNIRLGTPYQSVNQSISQPSINQSINQQSLIWHLPMTAEMGILNTGPFSATIGAMTSEIRFQSINQSISPLIGTLDLPAMHINGDTYMSINQSMLITNQSAFDDLMKSMINQPSVDWLIDCSGSITIGALTYPIDMSKSIEIPGMNGLNNVTVKSFSMDQSTNQSINVNMTISIFNPSNLTIASLGDLHFDVLYRNPANTQVVIGDVWAYNVSLLPESSNQLTLTGSLSSDPSVHSAQQALIQSFLQGLPSLVQSIGKSTNQSTNLFAGGVDGLTLDVILPGNQINLVDQLVYRSINLSPSAINQSVILDADISVTINSPLGTNSFIDLVDMSLDAQLMHNNQLVGVITSPMSPVNQTNNQFVFNTTIHALLQLDDSTAFEHFVSDFVINQSISLTIIGNTSVDAKFPLGLFSIVDIPITTTSVLTAMDGLHAVEQNLTILGPRSCTNSSFGPSSDPPYCGELVALTAALFNPSAASVDLKGSMFDMWFDSSSDTTYGQSSLLLGSVSSSELVVRPQKNIEVLTGSLYPANPSSHRSSVNQPSDHILMAEFIDRFLHGQPSTVRLVGKADPSLPPNSAAALAAKAVNLTADVPGEDVAGQLITGLKFNNFHISFSPSSSDDDDGVFVNAVIDASFQLPSNLRLSMNISELDLLGTVLFNDNDVGQLQIADQPVVHIHGVDGADQLLLTIVNAPLTIGNASSMFEKFATALVLDDIVDFAIATHADPTASTALGILKLHDVTAFDAAAFKGLNSFRSNGHSVLSILSYSIINASPDWLIVNCSISIDSPSNVSMSGLGEMLLDLHVVNGSSSVRLGRVQVEDFALPLGMSFMYGIANLSRPDSEVSTNALRVFISSMINQTQSDIGLHGLVLNDDGSYSPGTSITLLQPAISALVSDTTFPGIKDQFIVSYQAQLTAVQLAELLVTGKCSMSTRMEVNNPFDTYIGIGAANIDVYIAGTPFQMGNWINPNVDPPILIEPNSVSITAQDFTVEINLSGNEIQKLYDILNATIHGEPLYLDSIGQITTGIAMEPQLDNLDQSFVTVVDVDARHVPCVLKMVFVD